MKEHLYIKFKELADHCGWDCEIQGNSVYVLFSTANRSHLDEFIGLCALMPNIKCEESILQLSTETWNYEVRYPIDKLEKVEPQVTIHKTAIKR